MSAPEPQGPHAQPASAPPSAVSRCRSIEMVDPRLHRNPIDRGHRARQCDEMVGEIEPRLLPLHVGRRFVWYHIARLWGEQELRRA